MSFSKEDADKALEGLGFTVTARRGGNLQVSFADLASFKHVVDEATGEELQTRDESIMRAQLAAVDALRGAGAPGVRISNIRRIEEGEKAYYTFSPSIWVNNTSNVGASAAAVAKANSEVQAMKAQMEALLSLLPKDVIAKLQPQAVADNEEIPL